MLLIALFFRLFYNHWGEIGTFVIHNEKSLAQALPAQGNQSTFFVDLSIRTHAPKEAIIQFNFNAESGVCYNRSSNRFAPQASTSGINWGTYRATRYAYDLHYGTYPGDPRVETNVLTQWRVRSGNNQASPKPQVTAELCPGDSVYAYPKRLYMPTGGTLANAVMLTMPYDLFADKTPPRRRS